VKAVIWSGASACNEQRGTKEDGEKDVEEGSDASPWPSGRQKSQKHGFQCYGCRVF
jgi:hypothetical protein